MVVLTEVPAGVTVLLSRIQQSQETQSLRRQNQTARHARKLVQMLEVPGVTRNWWVELLSGGVKCSL